MCSKYPLRASRAQPIALVCVKLAFWIKNLVIGTMRTFAYLLSTLAHGLPTFKTDEQQGKIRWCLNNQYLHLDDWSLLRRGRILARKVATASPSLLTSALKYMYIYKRRTRSPTSFSDRYMVHTGRVFQNYCVSFHVFYWASLLRALLSPARNVFCWFILVTLWRPMREGKLLWQIPVVVYLFFDIFRTH